MIRILTCFILLTLTSLCFAGHGTAVVIIDMQDGFYQDANTIKTAGLKQLVATQQKLIIWARARKVPVLIFEFEGKGKTDPRIVDSLKGMDFKIIQKTTDDGFSSYNESISETLKFLKTRSVKKLIVSGINGGSCVHDSIQGAGVHGFVSYTTGEIVGDISVNPPVYPDASWFYSHPALKTYRSFNDLLKAFK